MSTHTMNNREDIRRPEEIENDIERTRADVSSTIDAIQEKLTPGQLMDQALQYVRNSGTGDFGANLGRSLRDNPVPVALIGVGIAWLAMGGRGRSDTSAWDEERALRSSRMRTDSGLYEDDYLVDRPDVPYEFGYEVSVGSSMRPQADASRFGSGLEDDPIAEDQSGAGERMRNAVGATAGRVRDTVSGAAESVKETITGATRHARHTMGDARHGVRSRAGVLENRARMQTDRARNEIRRIVDDQPMVLGAIGLAIGAALGAALPATRREDRLMGDMRDGLIEGANDATRDGMRDVRASAQRVARTAREEVQRAIDPQAPTGAKTETPGQDASATPASAAQSTMLPNDQARLTPSMSPPRQNNEFGGTSTSH